MLERGLPRNAKAMAERNRAPRRVVDILEKATIGIGGTGDWGGEVSDFRLLASAFTDQLRWSSVFYRLLNEGMVRLPFNTIAGNVYGGSAAIVAPGVPFPVTKLDLSQAAQLERKKSGAIVALTRELLESGVGVEGILSRNMRAFVAAAVDAAFLDVLETGAPTSAATANVETDLETMRVGVGPTDQSQLFWITTPAIAALLSGLTASGSYRFPNVTWTGGEMRGIPLIASDQVDSGELALVDASRVAGAADPVEIDTSQHSLLEATDAPSVGSPVGVGIGTTATISLWQQNLHGLRVNAYWGAEKLRANAAYFLTAVGWTST